MKLQQCFKTTTATTPTTKQQQQQRRRRRRKKKDNKQKNNEPNKSSKEGDRDKSNRKAKSGNNHPRLTCIFRHRWSPPRSWCGRCWSRSGHPQRSLWPPCSLENRVVTRSLSWSENCVVGDGIDSNSALVMVMIVIVHW